MRRATVACHTGSMLACYRCGTQIEQDAQESARTGEGHMFERSLVFMFSGQGSQYYQMGRIFFDGNATFRNTVLQLNDVAAPLLGRSIIDVLYNDGRRKDEQFE